MASATDEVTESATTSSTGGGDCYSVFKPLLTMDDLASLSGVTCVMGDVILVGAFTGLEPLSDLEVIHGKLVLGDVYVFDDYPAADYPNGPESLLGLDSLSSVDGLWIVGNRLTSLKGLQGLSNIGNEGLWIEDPGASDLAPLANLTAISGPLWVGSYRAMYDLKSLGPLAQVGHLQRLPWAGLTALSIRRTGLVDLGGLSGIEGIDGVIDIGLNPELTSVGSLSGLQAMGYLIYANPLLSECEARSVVYPSAPERVVGNLDDGCTAASICEPFDAAAYGPCEALVPGVRWTGTLCAGFGSGCECTGSECPLSDPWQLRTQTPDMQACQAAFSGC